MTIAAPVTARLSSPQIDTASISVVTAMTISAGRIAASLAPVHRFLVDKWRFDELYGTVVVGGTLALTRVLNWVDSKIIDGAVNGAGWATRGTSFVSSRFDTLVIDGIVNLSAYLSGFGGLVLRKFQTGKVQTYVLFTVASVLVLYFVFRMV